MPLGYCGLTVCFRVYAQWDDGHQIALTLMAKLNEAYPAIVAQGARSIQSVRIQYRILLLAESPADCCFDGCCRALRRNGYDATKGPLIFLHVAMFPVDRGQRELHKQASPGVYGGPGRVLSGARCSTTKELIALCRTRPVNRASILLPLVHR